MLFWMLDDYSNVWFDGYSSDDCNMFLRILHWLLNLILSYIAIISFFGLRFKLFTYIQFKNIEIVKYERLSINILIIFSIIVGITDILYAFTFKKYESIVINNMISHFWICRATFLWYVLCGH